MKEALRGLFRARVLVPTILTFVLGLGIYQRLILEARLDSPYTDHAYHVVLAAETARTGVWPGRPFYHFCILLVSGWHEGPALVIAAVVVLSLAVAGRSYLTALQFTAGQRPGYLAVLFGCLAVAVAMPLPNWWNDIRVRLPAEYRNFASEMPESWWAVPSIYHGQVSPNAWHSPTASIAMPFNLLLFLAAVRSLMRPGARVLALTGCVAMPLSLLAKPNFVMAFAPCFGLALLWVLAREVRANRMSIGAATGLVLLGFGPVVPLLAWQYFAVGAETGDPSKVTIDPFFVWRTESKNIPASILLGIAFPLVATVLYAARAVRSVPVVMAWATLALGITQFALISAASFQDRSSPGWGMTLSGQILCGIFGWGMIFADQVLFIVTADFLLRQSPDWRRPAAFGVLGLHAATGLFCLARCLSIPSMAGIF